jgi:hypothetical protein
MFWMFWYWRCIGFILWSGLCRVYHMCQGPGAFRLRQMRWRYHAEEEHSTALPPALASRRAADWRRIDAVLQSLRDPSTTEDEAA